MTSSEQQSGQSNAHTELRICGIQENYIVRSGSAGGRGLSPVRVLDTNLAAIRRFKEFAVVHTAAARTLDRGGSLACRAQAIAGACP